MIDHLAVHIPALSGSDKDGGRMF